MMKQFSIIFLSMTMLIHCSPKDWEAIQETAKEVLEEGPAPLSNQEVISGLKEALTIGIKNAAGQASKLDGFNKNQLIHIPWPEEANKMKSRLVEFGLKNQVDQFELTLNRAAEEASKEAIPVFVEAIKGMSIQDGFKILNDGNGAATTFLKQKTTAELTAKFAPITKNAINKVELTKYWNPLATKYNTIPFVEKVNPDLDQYVTERAIAGLFKLVELEENKIRQDPKARVTELLKRVFGS